ncbi:MULTISPECIES: phosphoglucosamine mutase [Terrabacteria group]|uniref:phosphoglucosamine mutase n=1 Tax=Bacillati TaxID=1783272 RepID=UPI001C6EEA97|nr:MULTISPECIES: phosphoglucosamine mutase [Terrabacteria group]MBW9212834.1 phosphoglucosamine mutase [Trueperella sp. zg.1013]
MGKYFGTDGIRGKANIGLTVDRAFQVGRYLGYYFSQEKKSKIVIGKDTRLSSDMLESALAAGIASQGCDVYLLGYGPTPVTCYIAHNEDFACGAMISASHNPFYDNGIKIFSTEGIKIPADLEDKIEAFIDGEVELEYATDEKIGKVYNYSEGLEHYKKWIANRFSLDLTGLRIAIDTANGAASYTAKEVLEDLGAKVDAIHMEPNGVNINTHCGSTHPEDMQEMMKKGDYAIGLTFDGDADRQIIVDKNGHLVNGDFVLYLFGKFLRDQAKLVDNTVVTTVMANLGLLKAFEKEGIQMVKTQVGDKYVYEEMCKYNYQVGGEQSGHIIFKEYATTGDGLLTALAVLYVMQETKKSLLELEEGLVIYPQVLKNVRVENKETVLESASLRKAIQESEKRLAGNGRVLVRPSGTEPLLRVMVEAATLEICEQEVEAIISALDI